MTSNYEQLVEEANLFAVGGNWHLAFERLAEAHRLKPDDVGVITGIGRCAIQLGQVEEGLSFFEQAIILAPDSSDAHNNLGVIQGLLGYKDKAEDSYQMAITLNPDNAQAWINLAKIYLEQDTRVSEGVKILYAVVQAYPSEIEAWYLLAICYSEIGDIESARSLFNNVLHYDPDHPQTLAALKQLEEISIDESTKAVPGIKEEQRIARPEHAKKLASLKGLIKRTSPNGSTHAQSSEPTTEFIASAVAFFGPPQLSAEARLSPPARALYQSGTTIKLSLHMEPADISKHDIFLFANPHFNPELLEAVEQVLAEKTRRGTVRVAIDIDQDYFHMPKGEMGYSSIGPGNAKVLDTLKELLKQVDLVTVPSLKLAEVFKNYAKRVEFIPPSWSQTDSLWDKPAPKRRTTNIGVVSTHTGNKEVKLIKDEMKQVIDEENTSLLTIGGDTTLADAFNSISDDRKSFIPIGQVKDYPYLLSNFDILLFPHLDNEYSNNLSDLPLMEAGIRRIPWIASPLPSFKEWNDGGLFAEKKGDWYEQVRKLIKDTKLREELGIAGRQKADTREADQIISRWKEILFE